METIGELLKNRRVERGLSLAEVNGATKISAQNLAALEEDRFDAFPNRVYARAFLRDYANYLDMESAALLERLEGEWGAAPTVAPPRAGPSRRWAFGVGLAAIVVAGGIGGAYYYLYLREGRNAWAVLRPAPKPSPPPSGAARPPIPSPIPTEPKPVVVQPGAPPAPAVPPGQVKVTFHAMGEPVWILVKVDGERAYMDTLAAGDTAAFLGKKVFVQCGKAHCLGVTVNGQDKGRLGPAYRVVKRTFSGSAPRRRLTNRWGALLRSAGAASSRFWALLDPV